MPPRVRAAAAALMLMAGCAFGCAPPHPYPEGSMRVEADLFSGRPNPSFTLDAEQAATLATLLRGLPAGGERREPPGLGYRGFVIRDTGDALPGCTALRAFHGTVHAECGAEARLLADPAQTVERWLLDVARPRLSAEVVDAIRGELPRP